jgi:putative cell wall-binding protein/sugar lactone lactonase YvrE
VEATPLMRRPIGLVVATVTTAATIAIATPAPAGTLSTVVTGLHHPAAVAAAPDGSAFVAEAHRVVRIAGGTITPVAGGEVAGFAGDDGPATDAQLSSPRGMALGGDGALFVADSGNDRIRRIDAGGAIATIAGSGARGSGGDGGAATAAQLDRPTDVAVGADGTVYIADTGNDRIRRVAPDGTITAVAGATTLADPTGVAIDGSGALLVADTFHGRVVRIGTDGGVATLAGGGPGGGICDGDGVGPATALAPPTDLALDSGGNLFIAEPGAGRVRVLRPDGWLTTVAGIGAPGAAAGGVATESPLGFPSGVAVASDGSILVADSGGDDLLRVAEPIADAATNRLAGVDRYETAAAAAARFAVAPIGVLYVASGQDGTDALAAGAAAGAQGAPVLLTERDRLPEASAAEIRRSQPTRVVVVGGPAAVSDAVLAAISRLGVPTVDRVAGADRYETAAMLSRATYADGAPDVLVVAGTRPVDAVAAAAAGARRHAPMLLVAPDEVPEGTRAELQRLRATGVSVVGGPAAVSDGVVAALGATRIAGDDRFATAAALVRASFPDPVSTVLVSNGASVPDGVVSGAAAAMAGGAALPVTCHRLPHAVADELARLRAPTVLVVGGPAVVADDLAGRVSGS